MYEFKKKGSLLFGIDISRMAFNSQKITTEIQHQILCENNSEGILTKSCQLCDFIKHSVTSNRKRSKSALVC